MMEWIYEVQSHLSNLHPREWGRGSGLVVSNFDFYSNGLSSNPGGN